MSDYKAELEKQPCICVRCPDCDGSGGLWVTLDGKYHKYRCDDMGDLEACDSCRGLGITEICNRCLELEQAERDENDERWA